MVWGHLHGGRDRHSQSRCQEPGAGADQLLAWRRVAHAGVWADGGHSPLRAAPGSRPGGRARFWPQGPEAGFVSFEDGHGDESARDRSERRGLLGGVMTHFASSEIFTNTRAGEQTRQQEERFYAALERMRSLGIDPGIVHLANSAAIVSRPETWADMVRPGAILYG